MSLRCVHPGRRFTRLFERVVSTQVVCKTERGWREKESERERERERARERERERARGTETNETSMAEVGR